MALAASASARATGRVVKRKLADGSTKAYAYPPRKATIPQRDTVRALITAYRSSPEWTSLKAITRSNYGAYIRVLEDDLDVLDAPLSGLRKRQLLGIRDIVASQNGPSSANGFTRAISTILNWAVAREWIDVNPLAGTKSLQCGHWRAWTDAEYQLAHDKLPEHLRRVIVLARHTGQRRGDLIAMRWGAYDGRYVTVRQEKGRRGEERDPLTIPAPAALRKELDAWRGDAPDDALILTNKSGGKWCDVHLSRNLGNTMEDIDPKLDGLNVHGLRKLAAASLAEAGCSSKEIASITGHRTLAMVELYTQSAQQKTLAESAVRRMDEAAEMASKRRQNAL